MKCPKCQYLGFETGHRCRNCGYDFSLLALAEPDAAPDLPLQPRVDAPAADGAAAASRPADLPLRPAHVRTPAPRRAPVEHAGHEQGAPAAELPLFAPDVDDQPLITVPSAPRPPLAVRKTPDLPRAAGAPRVVRRDDRPRLIPVAEPPVPPPAEAPSDPAPAAAASPPPRPAEGCRPRVRLLAALVDLSVLLALDAVIVYFTLRMAGLEGGDWTRLPILPMAAFLAVVKVAYVSTFTAIGGQTIGKMALQIRVVTEEQRLVRPVRALVRAVMAGLLLLPLGAGFFPALFDGGRALHDRLVRTRVIAVPPAGSS